MDETPIKEMILSGSGYITFKLMSEEAGDDIFLGQFKIPLKTLIDQNEHAFSKGLLSDEDGSIIDDNVWIEIHLTLV